MLPRSLDVVSLCIITVICNSEFMCSLLDDTLLVHVFSRAPKAACIVVDYHVPSVPPVLSI
jgi:hypothetical protein